jgi:hypothetical protein
VSRCRHGQCVCLAAATAARVAVRPKQTEITRRIGIAAIAIFHSVTAEAMSNPGLSYAAALGFPWDVVQVGARPSAARTRIV